MTDYVHVVELTSEGTFCKDCGVGIPLEVGSMDSEVVSMGGGNVHWIPAFAYDGKTRSCLRATGAVDDSVLLVCSSCGGEGCDDCGNFGVIGSQGSLVVTERPPAEGGETLEVAPPLTEVEKMAGRAGFQNFLMMRETLNPDGS